MRPHFGSLLFLGFYGNYYKKFDLKFNIVIWSHVFKSLKSFDVNLFFFYTKASTI